MTRHRLYYSPGACSLAVHIVLEEISAPYLLVFWLCRQRVASDMTQWPRWSRLMEQILTRRVVQRVLAQERLA